MRLLYAIGLVCWAVLAQGATLAWDASPPEVVSYTLYWGGESGVYTNSAVIAAPSTSVEVQLDPGPTYYFAVTAFDGRMESDYSAEISYQPVVVSHYVGHRLKHSKHILRFSIQPKVKVMSGRKN